MGAVHRVNQTISENPYGRLLALTEQMDEALASGCYTDRALASLGQAYEETLSEVERQPECSNAWEGAAMRSVIAAGKGLLAVERTELAELCDRALAEAELAVARKLVRDETDIHQALALVRTLAGEVLDGAPVLVSRGDVEEADGEQRVSMTLHQLPTWELDTVDRAMAEARLMVSEVSG